MRGDDQVQEALFSYGSLSQRVPMGHPLRRIQVLADEAMATLSVRFEQMYSKMGRPSVPAEQLLRALLLQMLYSVGVSGCWWSRSTSASCFVGSSA